MNCDFFPAMRDVGARIASAPHLLLGLDYDGTLTPLVETPAQAHLCSSMRQALWSLAGREGVSLAIMGGRTSVDLQEHVGVSGAIYVGNHGLEIHGPSFTFVQPTARERAETLKSIANDLSNQLRHISGVVIEDKGLTLTVHQRRVAPTDHEEVWRAVYMVAAKVKDLFQLTAGHKVYEIRPLVPWDKGAALQWIQQQLRQPNTLMIYLGDDAIDEDAFRTLADAITIKVGGSSASAAQYLMPSPAEVQCFLEWIHDLLREKDADAADSRRIIHHLSPPKQTAAQVARL